MLFGQRAGVRAEFGVRGGDGDARAQPADGHEGVERPHVAALGRDEARPLEEHRHPHVGGLRRGRAGLPQHIAQRKHELRRGDADDRQRLVAAHHDAPADHTGIGAKARAPRAVTDDGDVSRVGGDRAAQLRAQAEQIEQRRAHAHDLQHALVLLAVDGHAHEERQRVVQGLERTTHAAEVVEVGGRERIGLTGRPRILAPQHRQALGRRVREGLEQHAVHHGEHGAVGAETQAEGQHRQRGEGARAGQAAHGGGEVRTKAVPHGGSSPGEGVEVRTMRAPGQSAHGGAPFGQARGRGVDDERGAAPPGGACCLGRLRRRGVPAFGERRAEVGAELRAKLRGVSLQSSAQQAGQRV